MYPYALTSYMHVIIFKFGQIVCKPSQSMSSMNVSHLTNLVEAV
jgi:hypothetical protein